MTETSPVNAVETPTVYYLKDYQVPNFLIDSIHLDVDLNEDATWVKSNLQIRRNPASTFSNQDLSLDGEELILESIKLNGQTLATEAYQLSEKHLIIFNPPQEFELEIITKIFPQKNTELHGLYRSRNTYCTQCEAQGFRRITFFKDQPDILSRYTTKITADAKQYPYLLSNGNLVASGQLENGRHWAQWEDPFKKPCYLFALVAGDFDVNEDTFKTMSGRTIQLRSYVEKGFGDQAHHAMYSLKEAMRWDEKAYGREYDLDVFMMVAISDFNMGAMENKGLNIFNTKYLLAKPETATDQDYIYILDVVGHEYFHNWSGNRVTCRDWFQLSLKEGLTIFRDQSFCEDTLSHALMRIQEVSALRETQFPEDAGPLAHPVLPDSYIEINNFYTSTIYNKGAEVLRMLRTILGKDTFRKGMDLYFSRYDGQAVTIEDYVKSMEEVSGLDLQHFRLWYRQSGTPIVTVEEDYSAADNSYLLTLSQTTPATPGQTTKSALHIPVRMGLLDKNGNAIALELEGEHLGEETVLHLTKDSQQFKFTNVTERPVPSLLRDFSAPVKLKTAYSDADLQFLFKHDKDAFNRWEAGQMYAVRILLNLVQAYQRGDALTLPAEFSAMFDYVLQQQDQDKILIALMLNLPSEKYIGEQMQTVAVDGIHAAREFVSHEIAQRLEKTLLTVYEKNHTKGECYEFNIHEMGKRQLKNRALAYLLSTTKFTDLGVQQFESTLKTNMTDAQAALNALANLDTPIRERALNEFYITWKHDALVIDKWLSIQASSKLPNTLLQVRKLMRHESFDLKNPNKVYSLIGAFSRNNIHFHAENGEGYAFLREAVHQLDKINPMIAARMVVPLTTWKRYDKQRQELMREQLELLMQDKKISRDLYEMVSKSL